MDEDFVIPSMPAHPAENQVITINFEEPKKLVSKKDKNHLHLKSKTKKHHKKQFLKKAVSLLFYVYSLSKKGEIF